MKKMTINVPDNFSWENKINILSIITGISKNEVAKAFDVTPGTFLVRSRNGRFDLNDLRKIASVYNGKLIMRFTYPDGKIFDSDNYDDLKDLIYDAKEHISMTWASLAGKLGKTYSAFIQILDTGKLTEDRLLEITEALNCKYENYIMLENGSVI